MPPDSLVLNLNIVQGGTNAKPENVIRDAIDVLNFEIYIRL